MLNKAGTERYCKTSLLLQLTKVEFIEVKNRMVVIRDWEEWGEGRTGKLN